MKKFLIAGSSLAAVAAAGSAGAVDVTLGGSIDVGVEYGVGKAMKGNHFGIVDNYQTIAISVGAAGTTDAGLKFGGNFSLSTAAELVFDPYHVGANDKTDSATSAAGGSNNKKYLYKKVNTDATANLRGVGYNVSGGGVVSAGKMVSVKINSAWHAAEDSVVDYNGTIAALDTKSVICKLAGEIVSGAAGN
ncbi:MAG: porin, partial [Alphaproteobacteria bacterium]|nr:porin [Alphaproteobacteria bacterium]